TLQSCKRDKWDSANNQNKTDLFRESVFTMRATPNGDSAMMVQTGRSVKVTMTKAITCLICRCSTDASRPALELWPANRQAVSSWNSKLTPYRLFLLLEFRGPRAPSTWRLR